MTRSSCAFFLVFGTATSAQAAVVWRGDFETGDRSQWSETEEVSPDRLRVVTSPVAEGRYALCALVKQGDDPINASGNRNELVYYSNEPVNSEYYYRWRVMFDPSFPSANTWQLFTQWHHHGSNGSPPMEFSVEGEKVMLGLGGNNATIVWQTALVRGVWHDFILHAKWSPDPAVGFVELYYDGALVLPKRMIATQFSGMLNYLKLGLYRDEAVAPDGIVFHDGMVQATTLADVLSSSGQDGGAAADAGSPGADAGIPGADAGSPPADAGTRQDAGSPAVDGGPPPVDGGPPHDGGAPADGGSVDAGHGAPPGGLDAGGQRPEDERVGVPIGFVPTASRAPSDKENAEAEPSFATPEAGEQGALEGQGGCAQSKGSLPTILAALLYGFLGLGLRARRAKATRR